MCGTGAVNLGLSGYVYIQISGNYFFKGKAMVIQLLKNAMCDQNKNCDCP